MGLGCVLFLWGVMGAIALAVAATGAVICLASAARRSKFGMLAGAAIGAVGGLAATCAALFIGGWLFWGMWPHETTSRSAFADAFGVSAGSEVTEIRSKTSSSSDSHEQFLRFHSPRATIALLVRSRWKRSTPEDCRQESLQWQHDAPEWWTASYGAQTECYTADPYDTRLSRNNAWLLYDGATGTAHFHYVGID